MKRILYLLIVVLFTLSSCRDKDLDMTLMSKTIYEGAVINEITASDAWHVTVIQDENTFVELEYSAFLEEYLRVTNSDSELKIGFSRSLNIPSNTVMNATVHTPSLQKVHLSEAVSAVLDGHFPEASLTMELEDAATCKGGDFSGRADVKLSSASTLVDCYFHGPLCNIELDDASVFKGWFTEDSLFVKLNGASRLTTYGGVVGGANVEVSEASSLNMLQTYISRMMFIVVQDASEASIAVTRPAILEGFVMNASALHYQGNPILDVACDATSTLSPL